MKAINLNRPELSIIHSALSLAADMMAVHSERQGDNGYAEAIEEYRKVAGKVAGLIQFGDAAEAAGQDVSDAAGRMIERPGPKKEM